MAPPLLESGRTKPSRPMRPASHTRPKILRATSNIFLVPRRKQFSAVARRPLCYLSEKAVPQLPRPNNSPSRADGPLVSGLSFRPAYKSNDVAAEVGPPLAAARAVASRHVAQRRALVVPRLASAKLGLPTFGVRPLRQSGTFFLRPSRQQSAAAPARLLQLLAGHV